MKLKRLIATMLALLLMVSLLPIGEPELLEEELVRKFFGGSGEYIAFRAARDLFA